MDGNKIFTVENIKKALPECYEAIWREGFLKGLDQGKKSSSVEERESSSRIEEKQPSLSLEDQGKEKWRKDPGIRAEFGQSESRYLAYVRHTGQI